MKSQVVALALSALLAIAVAPNFEFELSSVDLVESTVQSASATPLSCCKICRKGKACGNSCIARHLTCHQPPGCACNGALDVGGLSGLESDDHAGATPAMDGHERRNR